MKLWMLSLLGASLAVAAACSDGDDSTDPDRSGAGGAGDGTAGADGAGEGPGSAGSGGAGCAEDGSGSVQVVINGLPAGVDAAITLEGAASTPVTASETLTDLAGGSYRITAERVFDTDPMVRTVYHPTLATSSLCLGDGETSTLTVTYAAIPTSNKLWSPNGNADAGLLAFGSDVLAESGTPDGDPALAVPVGTDIVFDRDGNLWAKGATLAEPHIVRYSASDLARSGAPTFDRGFNISDVPCIPALRALAFDPHGNLWASTCGEVVRLASADLVATGTREIAASATLSGLVDNQDLAFDADGNLWVADDGRVVRFDSERLTADDSAAPDRTLTISAGDTRTLGASFLAFDSAGALWVADFGGNSLSRLPSSALNGSGEAEVTADVTFTLDVGALFARPAFDDSGALWIAYTQGKIAGLSAEQLTVSSGPGAPVSPAVVIDSPNLNYAANLAFFPAPAGLPLFHSLP